MVIGGGRQPIIKESFKYGLGTYLLSVSLQTVVSVGDRFLLTHEPKRLGTEGDSSIEYIRETFCQNI